MKIVVLHEQGIFYPQIDWVDVATGQNIRLVTCDVVGGTKGAKMRQIMIAEKRLAVSANDLGVSKPIEEIHRIDVGAFLNDGSGDIVDAHEISPTVLFTILIE